MEELEYKKSSPPLVPLKGENVVNECDEKAKAIPKETIIAIAEYYNYNCDMLTQLEVLDERLGMEIARRIAEHGEETVKTIILKANNNAILRGDFHISCNFTVATLPWLMEKSNFDDILKGKYEFKQYQWRELTEKDWATASGIQRKQIDVRL